MTRLLLSMFFWAMSIPLFSQNASITGRITLLDSPITIPGVNVYTKDGKNHTISDVDGNFTLNLSSIQPTTIIISSLGFKTIEKAINIKKDESTNYSFELQEEILDLPIIEINAHSATGGMMGSMEIPGSSHYISNRELKELQSTNPHDILQRIPGLQIQEEDGFGLRPNIGLRASGSERSSKITILEDGVLAAPAPYAAPSAYYFPTIARMSGIEVQKGASQIAEGPYTTGGIINLLSTPVPSSRKGLVQMNAGSFGSRNIHAHFGDKQGNIGYLIETFQYNANGFKTIDYTRDDTGFDKKDFLGKIKWSSSPGSAIFQTITLKIAESRERSDETYLGLSYNDFLEDPFRRYAGSQTDEMNTLQRQLSLKHIINPVSNIYIQTTLYRNSFARNWYKLDKVAGKNGQKMGIASVLENPSSFPEEFSLISGRSTQQNESLSVKANNRSYISRGIQSKINYLKDHHSLAFGVRWHFDEMDRFQWVDSYGMDDGFMKLLSPGIAGTESNRIESASALAIYAQYSWENEHWGIQGGIRREQVRIARLDYGKNDPERIGSDLNSRENKLTAYIPGINITYKIDETQQIFSGVHRGFAPPGSSPSTNPESSTNYEIGYRIEKSNLYSSAVVFFNDYSNLLGSDLASSGGLGTGDQFNGGSVRSYGLELAMNYRKKIVANIWMPIQIQYTFNHASFDNNFDSSFDPWGTVEKGDFLPYLAPHTFTLTSGVRWNKLSWNMTGSYMDDMRIFAGQGALMDHEKINGRLLLSTTFQVQLKKDVTLLSSVHNLTNRYYAVATRPAGWRPGAPRNINVGLQVQF